MRSRATFALLATALVLVAGCLDASQDPGQDDPVDQTGASGDLSDEHVNDSNDSTEPTNRSSEPDENASAPPPEGNETADDAEQQEVEQPPWPPLGEARVRPGVQVSSSSGQCTSNFLFRSPDNATLMLGIAAHCVNDGPSTATNGCDDANEPFELGETVRIEGAANPGVLVYSSWRAMQEAGESNDEACRSNDFALVAIHDEDRDAVHPAVRHFGGPSELVGTGGLSTGDRLLYYGNSGTRQGIEELRQNDGYVISSSSWRIDMYGLTPGVPGDSGSAVLTADGAAAGVLVTVASFPPGANGVTSLAKALSYANEHGPPVELVTWDQLDDGRLLP